MTAIRSIETRKMANGGYVSTIVIDGHDVLVYQPLDKMESDIINYGYSAPLLLVFGKGRFTEEEAAEHAEKTKLALIAQENGGSVVYVNPLTEWEKEEPGLYEKVISKTKIKQEGFAHGMLYDDKVLRGPFAERMRQNPNWDPVPEYFIFGSPVACYVYGEGKGADYLARYYMKEVSGKSSMGDLGFADITMTGVTLMNLSVVPEVEVEDISIVSIGNSAEINEAFRTSNNRVAVCDELDVIRQYDDYLGDYKRWAGKIRKSVNFRKEGIVMKPERMAVHTSADNRHYPAGTETHEAGYVLFYNENLDLDDITNPVPLVLCFHGGGDTAVATAAIGEWPQIASENGFVLCAVEMHLNVTATETIEIVDSLIERYAIDPERIYATGFSMGGIKSWDFYQEYPERVAAIAPMDATVDVGENTQFSKSFRVNDSVMVPVFYNGGENSPLAELPCQEPKCVNRMVNLFRINKVKKAYNCTFENKAQWEDPVYGVRGEHDEILHDPDYPNSVTNIRRFESEDGNVYTELCSISNHQHEIRPFTCRRAWKFMKQFRRTAEGKIEMI